jgi:hypothetical protein
MRCPVCDAENLDDSPECIGCGKELPSHAKGGGVAAPPEGLEMTQVAPPDLAARIEPLAGLERTAFPDEPAAQPQWTAGPLPLERTLHEVGDGAQGAWSGPIEVDRAREPDIGERTPLPTETAICPWCGTASLDAVCDACGRRKARFAGPEAEVERRLRTEEIVTCPACFARVAREMRCSDCGVPFPLQEL